MIEFSHSPFVSTQTLLAYMRSDSMEPTVRAGDMIFIDYKQQSLATEGIYVLQYRDQYLVKRVIRDLNRGQIWLISDNANYENQMLSNDDDFEVVGRVTVVAKQVA